MIEVKNEYLEKLTGVQKSTLASYSALWDACIRNRDVETSYVIYCKMLGYLDALMDLGQITKDERDKIIRYYAQ